MQHVGVPQPFEFKRCSLHANLSQIRLRVVEMCGHASFCCSSEQAQWSEKCHRLQVAAVKLVSVFVH